MTEVKKDGSGGGICSKRKDFPPPQGDVLWFDPNFETATFVFHFLFVSSFYYKKKAL